MKPSPLARRIILGAFLGLWALYLWLGMDALLGTESLAWLWRSVGRGSGEVVFFGLAVHFVSLLVVRWGVSPWQAEGGNLGRWAGRLLIPLLVTMALAPGHLNPLGGALFLLLGAFTWVDSLMMLHDWLARAWAARPLPRLAPGLRQALLFAFLLLWTAFVLVYLMAALHMGSSGPLLTIQGFVPRLFWILLLATHTLLLLVIRWSVYPWFKERGGCLQWTVRLLVPVLYGMGPASIPVVGDMDGVYFFFVLLGMFVVVDSAFMMLDLVVGRRAANRKAGAAGPAATP
ncbi:hypothetical protein IIA16_07055 [bacterium]|nr:hypothetical protein [bacterium]